MADDYLLTYEGDCPICEAPTTFVSKDRWLRGGLTCRSCTNGSVPRERALAHVLNRVRPDWRDLTIHESSPASRGISLKMSDQCRNYTGSHYYPDKPFGEMVDGFRNESLDEQTFADESFDLVVTLDVFEHVFQPGKMIKEIYRTLKPGGLYLCTFPIRKHQVTSHRPRVRKEADGSLTHLDTVEIHGNPVSGDGALVTFDYGYDIHNMLAYWVPFEVEISRFNIRRLGILGEYTEVITCEKPKGEAR
ncbi:MAG: methyltransferase domain-containing protein [Alphaproteobacteria bacterium]|nr:methyltransferase domain-containing protein [Alphaproteobacteria bacterium]